jgi:hypothetical protein
MYTYIYLQMHKQVIHTYIYIYIYKYIITYIYIYISTSQTNPYSPQVNMGTARSWGPRGGSQEELGIPANASAHAMNVMSCQGKIWRTNMEHIWNIFYEYK